VLIGGSGERKTLRMVAQYADACNVFGEPSVVRHLMDVLDEHCATIGRDPSTICRTRLATLVLGRTVEEAEAKITARLGAPLSAMPADVQERLRGMFVMGDAAAVQEQVQALLDAGLDGLVFNMVDAHDLESVAHAGEVLGGVLTR
jgi:alkanesulfonate monooxygenase SsuD/methylene tetrahydromethanopterin reductase-like flavin-dependent oxidoreductase (luciferase family)